MAVGEGLDVDDDLLAHLGAALDRGRAHMRKQDPAPAIWPASMARAKAASSITSPRAVFTMKLSGFISSIRRALSRWKVAGVCGQFTDTMSMRASIWSRLSQ